MSQVISGVGGASASAADGPRRESLAAVLDSVQTDRGESLDAATRRGPVLVLFVRHAGCTFCREALSDLARARTTNGGRAAALDAVVVQMGTSEQGRRLLDTHELHDVAVISDPERRLYRALDLGRGSLGQLFGPRIWWRGLMATLRGHFVGRLVGDGFQMPGAFVLHEGRVIRAFRHRDASDRPDFDGLCRLDGMDATSPAHAEGG